MASKYSVIIEAKLKEKSLQVAIDESSIKENPKFVINNIALSTTAIEGLKKQLETALSGTKVNLNTDNAKKAGKEISDSIVSGMNESQSIQEIAPANFDKINLAIQGSEEFQKSLKDGVVVQQQFNEEQKTIDKSLQNIGTTAKDTNKNVNNLGKSFSLALEKIMLWAMATTVIYGTLQQIEKMEQYVVDLNKAMTDIQLVNNMTNEGIAQLATEYNGLAKEMGATTLEVAKGSTEWINFSSL